MTLLDGFLIWLLICLLIVVGFLWLVTEEDG